jgi:ABC-type Fe3+-hydroxamate transport system substrate-binding protein
MTWLVPPYIGGGPATNLGYAPVATEFVPFNWATKGKENIVVTYTSNQPDPTGAASVVASLMYSGGSKATNPTDLEWLPDVNPLIAKGSVSSSQAPVTATSTAGNAITVPAWAQRIVGLKQIIVPNLMTAGEERVGYLTWRSTIPDWDPQEWPFAYAVGAPLGTPVGIGASAYLARVMATSFPMTGKNETLTPTIILNVGLTTGDSVSYAAMFA